MKIIKSFILVLVILCASTGLAMSQTQKDTLQTINIKVKGINCNDDVKTLSDNISKLNGVSSCKAGTAGATTSFRIEFYPTVLSEKDIFAAVENTPGCDNPEEKPYKVKK